MTDDFETFFRDAYPRLVAFGVAMSAPRAAAQDVAQDALLRAHQQWDEIGHYDQPFRWVRRVAGNLLIDRKRSTDSEKRAMDRLRHRPAGDHAQPFREVAAEDHWHDLTAGLTDRQRLIATLHYAEDVSVAEIAAELDVSEGTVKSTLSKARDNVRRALDADRTNHGEEATS